MIELVRKFIYGMMLKVTNHLHHGSIIMDLFYQMKKQGGKIYISNML